jgi:hypothetical protein
MKNNLKSELWDHLIARTSIDFGKDVAINLFKSGKILIHDVKDTYVCFMCDNAKDRKLYLTKYFIPFTQSLKKVKPDLATLEIKIKTRCSYLGKIISF